MINLNDPRVDPRGGGTRLLVVVCTHSGIASLDPETDREEGGVVGRGVSGNAVFDSLSLSPSSKRGGEEAEEGRRGEIVVTWMCPPFSLPKPYLESGCFREHDLPRRRFAISDGRRQRSVTSRTTSVGATAGVLASSTSYSYRNSLGQLQHGNQGCLLGFEQQQGREEGLPEELQTGSSWPVTVPHVPSRLS